MTKHTEVRLAMTALPTLVSRAALSSFEPFAQRIQAILGCSKCRCSLGRQDYVVHAEYCEGEDKDEFEVGRFRLTPMPGCHGVGISHAVYISVPFRNLGIGALLAEFRLGLAKQEQWATLLCTVQSTNMRQQHLLAKTSWKMLREFLNPKTTNKVQLWALEILYE